MDLVIAGILVAIILAAVAYFVLKNVVKLIINSILGLIILFLVNHFHVMSWVGKPDIAITWVTVLICALGGIPGALLLILLHLLGFSL